MIRQARITLVLTALAAAACSKEESVATESVETADPAATTDPAAARTPEPEPEEAKPEEPEPEEPGVTIVSVDRMYSSKGDQRPVQVELRLPPGWAPESGGGSRVSIRPEGGGRWPSLSVYILLDHQSDAREAIRDRVAKKRAKEPAGEVITVVEERELAHGGTLLAWKVDAREAKRKVHYFEVLCFLNRLDDPYVVLLQATANFDDDETALPEFAEICASARVLGPAEE